MAGSMDGRQLVSDKIVRVLNGRAARLTQHSSADADDLVQDTFERALKNLHRFERGSNLQGWLTTIMTRLLIDQHRRRSRLVSMNMEDIPAPMPDETHDAETATVITAARLEEAFTRLPESFRDVLDMHQRKGLSYQRIARRLGVPIGTVGTRIYRAKRRLRALLAS
jgi:RNA polymerase sigma-70 factor (ECF subfamily)